MRIVLFLVLAACGGGSTEPTEPCEQKPNGLGNDAIASGPAAVGVSWVEHAAPWARYSAIVAADGTVGPAVSLAYQYFVDVQGAVGATSVAWIDGRGDGKPLAVQIQRGDTVTQRDVTTTNVRSPALVFDGTRYQLVWESSGFVTVQSLDEDGTLGAPVRLAIDEPQHVDVATDRAGTLFLRVEHLTMATRAFTFETATGDLQPAFTGEFGAPVFFDGDFHVPHETGLLAINAATAHDLRPYGSVTLIPALTRMYMLATGGVMALDASFAYLGRLDGFHARGVGTLADDMVRTERHETRLEIVRQSLAGEVWRTPLAEEPAGCTTSE